MQQQAYVKQITLTASQLAVKQSPIEYVFKINFFSFITIFLYTIPLLVTESTQLERNKTHWDNKYNKYLAML
jgi:hypothetical protein